MSFVGGEYKRTCPACRGPLGSAEYYCPMCGVDLRAWDKAVVNPTSELNLIRNRAQGGGSFLSNYFEPFLLLLSVPVIVPPMIPVRLLMLRWGPTVQLWFLAFGIFELLFARRFPLILLPLFVSYVAMVVLAYRRQGVAAHGVLFGYSNRVLYRLMAGGILLAFGLSVLTPERIVDEVTSVTWQGRTQDLVFSRRGRRIEAYSLPVRKVISTIEPGSERSRNFKLDLAAYTSCLIGAYLILKAVGCASRESRSRIMGMLP